MPFTTVSAKGYSWYHFRGMTEADFTYLQEHFKFHPLDYEDVRSDNPVSKMDTYRHYVFCVFHIPQVDPETDRIYGAPLYVFLSEEHLVTISPQQIPSVERLLERVQKSGKFRSLCLNKGPASLMYRLLLAAFRDGLPLLSHMTTEVTALEERVQVMHDRRTTVELGRVRRNVLFLRHIIDPQRHMVAALVSLKRPFLPDDLNVYFDDVHDTLDTLYLTADNLKLIIDGLFDVNEALLSHKTNNVITMLTFISAALMAPALVAGFYGMNVSWLPHHEDPLVVGLFFLISIVVVAVAVFGVSRSRH